MIKLSGPPYKSSMNQWYTQALFWDMSRTMTIDQKVVEPIFSLYDSRPDLINCMDTFVELRDPTGYKWAIQYLKSWEHWKRLMTTPWFSEWYDEAINELNTKLRSEAFDRIMEISTGSSAQAFPANKYIHSEEWNKKPGKRGRPSKEEVDGELKKQAKIMTREDEDLKRIGLKLIQGDKQ